MKKSFHHKNRQDSFDPVRAKKSLGQHFLKDENVAKRISETLNLNATNCVLEIGPGTGVLTKYLLERELQLSVMDVDRDSIHYLRNDFHLEHPKLSTKKLDILEADFLNYDLDKLFPGKQFAITGNFPYNISSQILFRTLENRERIPEFSGMFQKEVAKRICEKPGSKTYGILSVLTQAFYDAEYLFTVPPSVFSPPPKVESGVLRLVRKTDFELPCDEKLFFKVVKTAFQQRRKTLRNSLKTFNISTELKEARIFGQRPEQLSVTEFTQLTQKLDGDAVSNQ